MAVLLLDAGVWIAAKDREDRYSEPARRLVLGSEQPVAVLDLTFYEVANVIGARKRRLEEATDVCRLIAARCLDNVVAIDAELIRRGLEVAAEHGLTAYDAAYVAAARRHGWTLVSTDIADLVSKGLAVAPDAADYP
jgi:predicted nucleic acid-binding protein